MADRIIVAVELEDVSRDRDEVTMTFECGHTWQEWVPTRDCIGQIGWCPFCDDEEPFCNACLSPTAECQCD